VGAQGFSPAKIPAKSRGFSPGPFCKRCRTHFFRSLFSRATTSSEARFVVIPLFVVIPEGNLRFAPACFFVVIPEWNLRFVFAFAFLLSFPKGICGSFLHSLFCCHSRRESAVRFFVVIPEGNLRFVFAFAFLLSFPKAICGSHRPASGYTHNPNP